MTFNITDLIIKHDSFLYMLFEFLEFDSVVSLSLTCSKLFKVMNSREYSELWKQFIYNDAFRSPSRNFLPPNINWELCHSSNVRAVVIAIYRHPFQSVKIARLIREEKLKHPLSTSTLLLKKRPILIAESIIQHRSKTTPKLTPSIQTFFVKDTPKDEKKKVSTTLSPLMPEGAVKRYGAHEMKDLFAALNAKRQRIMNSSCEDKNDPLPSIF